MSVSYGIEMFGLIAGVLSTIALFLTLIRLYLPSVRMRELDAVMEETEALFHDAQEQGLLVDKKFVSQTDVHLASLRRSVFFMRTQVYSARTPWQQAMKMLTGLSYKIGVVHDEVKDVRAVISSTSADMRNKLEEQSTSRAVSTSAGSDWTHVSCGEHGGASCALDDETPLPSSSCASDSAVRRTETFTSDTETLIEELHQCQGQMSDRSLTKGWEQLPFAQISQ
ncbi:hypothetical protein FA95DRAFT_796373 [Auriscalpium vulgare]|uniref:Uncharacterized protein n=1 Tax=Auriscalpium vulgare TaxID=40419 RepID=A0ACB8S0V2_9AGAM|nr:hypothetical protein FA95DRAFT_796373 [Auriscalpium vulgare]